MFGAIKDKFKKIQALNEDKMLEEILSDETLQAQMVDLNQNQLYEEGIQADGTPTGEYAYNTIYGTTRFPGKIEKGQRYDHVTLKDTGDTYKSMAVKSIPEGIVIIAEDIHEVFRPSTEFSRGWEKGLGLTEESLSEIRPEIKERIREKVREAIA